MRHRSQTFGAWRRIAALAAMAVVGFAAAALHTAGHDHPSDSALTPTLTIAACAAHLRAIHVEAEHTVRVRECPACLLSHLNLGDAPALALALAPPAPRRAVASGEVAVVRLRDRHSRSPRAPPRSPV